MRHRLKPSVEPICRLQQVRRTSEHGPALHRRGTSTPHLGHSKPPNRIPRSGNKVHTAPTATATFTVASATIGHVAACATNEEKEQYELKSSFANHVGVLPSALEYSAPQPMSPTRQQVDVGSPEARYERMHTDHDCVVYVDTGSVKSSRVSLNAMYLLYKEQELCTCQNKFVFLRQI